MDAGVKLSERDVCTKFITPALVAAGWDVQTQIREEVGFTKGRIIVRGRLVIPAPAFKSARYFEYFVRTAKANLLEFAPATAQENINLEILSSVLIPLPPLAGQERIVAKVDELMALCDQLEVSLTTGETTRSRLLDAALHEALAPPEQLAA